MGGLTRSLVEQQLGCRSADLLPGLVDRPQRDRGGSGVVDVVDPTNDICSGTATPFCVMCCMAGRAYLYALGAAGERGVDRVLGWFAADVQRTMRLLGGSRISDLDRHCSNRVSAD